MTDDLPTPPLPLATARTRVVAEHLGAGARARALPAGALHHRRLLVLGHLAVLDPHVGHARVAPRDLRLDVALDLAAQRAARPW